jgi:hypothetical protein
MEYETETQVDGLKASLEDVIEVFLAEESLTSNAVKAVLLNDEENPTKVLVVLLDESTMEIDIVYPPQA